MKLFFIGVFILSYCYLFLDKFLFHNKLHSVIWTKITALWIRLFMTEIKQEPSAEVVTEQEDKGGIIINHYHSSRNAPLTVTKKETQPIVKPNFTNETDEDKEQYVIHDEFEEDFEVGDLGVIECATGYDVTFEAIPVSIDEIGQLVAMITSNKAPKSEDLPKLKETYNKLEGTDIKDKIIEASGQQK